MKTETKLIHFSEGIELESGEKLNSFDLMVETYGELNEGKSNAILLVMHFQAIIMQQEVLKILELVGGIN
tara:strand:- start:141 stop:350 length:210 start_codon:yes stop_codon:yes gene_type:complete